MSVFFTSDHHWGHENVIRYSNRPFSSVDEMDEEMIKRWNEVVKPNDLVYHLGDFTLGDDANKFLSRLRGNIKFVVPNFHHDQRWLKTGVCVKNVEILSPIYQIKCKETWIILCHYPFRSWEKSHYNSYHLFGHCHNQYKPSNLSLDIGVDSAYNILGTFRPFSIDEVFRILRGRIILNEQATLDC